jgi:large subunit ribosomal protein L1
MVSKISYPIDEALELIQKMPQVKFDSSLELHIKLNLSKKGDQSVRGTVDLPHPTGKKVKIAVFAETAKQKAAKDAGAEIVGADDLVEKVSKGFTGFDVAIATPTMMAKMGKLGKVLGVLGLMPSPKAGTITPEPGKLVEQFQKGRIEFRADKTGNIHQMMGKVSLEPKKLKENILVIYRAVVAAKPEGLKGTFVGGVTLASSMGPGVSIDLGSLK